MEGILFNVLSVLTIFVTFCHGQDDFESICGRNIVTDRGFIYQPRARRPDSDDAEPIGTWPWMVSIGKVGVTRRNSRRDRPWTHHCGGTLVTTRHVLTAAHCVEGREGRKQKLRFGDRNVSSSLDNRHVQLRGIMRVHLHPDYDYDTAYYDVAVIEMDSDVRLTNQVRPLCLPEYSSTFIDKYDKYHVKMTGWGKETRDSRDIDGMLLSVSLRVFSHRYCQDTHWARDDSQLKFQISRSLPDLFKSSVMCAGDESGGYGSCDGDSGSPIFYFQDELGSESAKYIMVGMVQGGLGFCGDSRFPGIYIRIEDEAILSFIQGIIGRPKMATTVRPKIPKTVRPRIPKTVRPRIPKTVRPRIPNKTVRPKIATTTTAAPFSRYRRSDLYRLAERGDLQGLTRAIRKGADVNRRFGQNGYGALHGASYNGSVEVARYLVSSGADVDLKSTEAARMEGHLPLVKYLVDEAGADVHARDSLGSTPLTHAVSADRVDVLRFLVQSGADINNSQNDGATPLIMTIEFASPNTLRTLLALGVDVEAKDLGGRTALHHAASSGRLEMVSDLVFLGGANPDSLEKERRETPLHVAADSGHLEVVQKLVEAGADVNLRNSKGSTPLRTAVRKGHIEVEDFLVSKGGTF